MVNKMRVFSGSANPALVSAVCERLAREGAIDGQSRMATKRFADGEIVVELGENVRGARCYVVQPTCAPVNDNLMELLVAADALKRASAEEIVAVVPYFGYARQDRKDRPRRPITAKLVADMLQAAGVDRVVTFDLHAAPIQGFFDIPVDNLYARPALLDYVRSASPSLADLVVMSPDVGGVVRARDWAERLGCGMGFIDKRRPAPNVSEVMNLVGDVGGRDVLIVDDMIDTAGTLCKAAASVMERGARSVRAAATHGVFSNDALLRVAESCLSEVIVTDTVPLPKMEDSFKRARRVEKLRVVSVAPVLASALDRIHSGRSISSLFD